MGWADTEDSCCLDQVPMFPGRFVQRSTLRKYQAASPWHIGTFQATWISGGNIDFGLTCARLVTAGA
jgi:hypothetical protein